MMEKIVNIFRVPELRKRIFFTVALLIVFRLGAQIPIPGINVSVLSEFFKQNTGGLLGLFDLFAGGALKKFTIFALGIMPYISSSIIMQLLTVVVPQLEKLSKEGEHGRKKIHQYTRYATVLICIVQSGALTTWMKGVESNGVPVVDNPGIGFVLLSIVTITTGTIFLMWLGEQITEYGIGNGISLIIFAGIVARLPFGVGVLIQKVRIGEFNPIFVVVVFGIFCLIVAFVVWMEQGQRRIPVQYAQRIVGRKVYGRQNTHLPLKLNPSGVIPIIFASAIMMLPSQLAGFLGQKIPFFQTIARHLQPESIPYLVLYGIMIIFFVYFYTFIQFNPKEVSENMQKYGGFIPGIRPGQNTSDYLEYVLNRLILTGAIFLAFVALLPSILRIWLNIPGELVYLMGGTSLIIIIGVDLDTMKQIESHLLMRHYDGFMKKGKMRGRWS